MRPRRNLGTGTMSGLALLGLGAAALAFGYGRARGRVAPPVEPPAAAPSSAATPEAPSFVAGAASSLAGPIAPARPVETPAPPPAAGGDAAKLVQDGEAALQRKDEVQGLLLLRRAAIERPATAEGQAAAARLQEVAAAAREDAKRAGTDAFAERNALSRAFLATTAKAERAPLEERIEELNKLLVFSSRPAPDSETHVVKAGDRLLSIAKQHKTTWTFLKRVNGMKSDAIRVGQRLKIPHGTVSLVVFKNDFQLVALLGANVLRAFDVGTGREDRTPEASFTIVERLVEPTWYAPDGKVHKFGTKENILGTRWLGFSRTESCNGFGIHGTAFPETIGTASSAGCIRMRNEEVEELYDLVADGATVRIQR